MEANAAADHLMRIVGGEAVACVGETTLERFESGLAFVVGDRGRAPGPANVGSASNSRVTNRSRKWNVCFRIDCDYR